LKNRWVSSPVCTRPPETRVKKIEKEKKKVKLTGKAAKKATSSSSSSGGGREHASFDFGG
jgi:hypothetical protein